MNSSKPLSIIVLISGSGSNLQAIIDAIAESRLNAKISAVISNKADAYGLQRAQEAGIATEIIEHNKFNSREDFDHQLTRVIEKYQPDLIVLAGFMRILTDAFVHKYEGKMINIHPSLLPRYQGLNTHQRVLEAGDKEHGLSIHFVSTELDGGPLIDQVKITVNKNDNAEMLAQRVLEQEHIAYPKVIQWIADKRIQLQDNKVLLDGQIVSGN